MKSSMPTLFKKAPCSTAITENYSSYMRPKSNKIKMSQNSSRLISFNFRGSL